MAEKSSFFDSVNADRVYYAADWASHMAEYFTNGIFNNGLKVVANNDMSVSIQLGAANVNGYKYKLDTSPKVIDVANADGILNRIDNIVIRLDIPNRQVTVEIVQGNFSENAVAPALTRGTSVYDLRIAKISIPAGTTAITQNLITDCRFNSNDCGNVICAVQSPDFTDILNQYEALWDSLITEKVGSFEQWFEEIKDRLDRDTAGHLLNLINTKANIPIYDTITLLTTNWVQSGDKYEYTVVDESITEDHHITCNMSIENQNKLKDAEGDSYNGGFIIRTTELPTEDITMDITIQKMTKRVTTETPIEPTTSDETVEGGNANEDEV